MSIKHVHLGENMPDEVNVIIEIPAQSGPVKYEADKETGALVVDRFMSTAMFYPCNYGYIPQTLSDDGDPVDVLVITPVPLISGSVVKVRPVGMLRMTDESGEDMKILAVPTEKLLPMYSDIREPADVSAHLLAMITHFFEHYKDLEKGKWVKVDGWASSEEAKAEIAKSALKYK
jgi:inorganic pyrophosphatase